MGEKIQRFLTIKNVFIDFLYVTGLIGLKLYFRCRYVKYLKEYTNHG